MNNQKISSRQIGKIFDAWNSTTRKWLREFDIPIRSLSGVMSKYPKFSFSGKPTEKAYLLGLRSGDIYARKHFKCVVVEVTSSKPEQIKMFQSIFSKYGKVLSYEKKGGATEKTTRAYCFLNRSFNFLIKKPASIPKWILRKKELFYSFLAGYVDSEGSWIITEHKKYKGKYKDLVFSLGTCDKTILEQIHQKLKEFGFNSHFYLVRKAGVNTGIGICNFDLYRVMIMRIRDVIKLAKILLPLSRHEEKKKNMVRIVELEPFFKRATFVEIPCPSCSHEKLWKCGYWTYKDKKYPRYVCPICREYFSERRLKESGVI